MARELFTVTYVDLTDGWNGEDGSGCDAAEEAVALEAMRATATSHDNDTQRRTERPVNIRWLR
jgi:hypothetical protein